MARPKKQETRQEAIPSVWDDLGIPSPNREPVRQETRYSSNEQADRQSADILDRLARLERDRSFDAYRGQPQAPAQTTNQQASTVRFDPAGLPDPLDNKDAYNKALADRVNAALDARDAAVRQELSGQSDRVNATTRLWEQMVEKHPEWQAHKSLVGSIAGEIVTELQARGVDTARYVFQESDRFSDLIAERLSQRGYDKIFADEGGEDDGKDEGKPEQKSQAWRGGMSEDEERRTDGIMGGMESGGAPSRGRKEEPQSDMISDMKAIQERLFNRPL